MKDLSEYFKKNKIKTLRNMSILKAYEDGYTQVEIAKYLGLSKSMISKIVKEESGNSPPLGFNCTSDHYKTFTEIK